MGKEYKQNSVELFADNPEALKKLQDHQSKWHEHRKKFWKIWRRDAKQSLSKQLPVGYSWKKRPSVQQIERLINGNENKWCDKLYKIGRVSGLRALTEYSLFKVPLDEATSKIYKTTHDAARRREAASYAKSLRKAAEVPALKLFNDTKDNTLFVASLYDIFYPFLEKSRADEDKPKEYVGDVSSIGRNKLVSKLYRYLKRFLAVDNARSRQYRDESPKTISFLNQLVFDLLPNQDGLSPHKIKSIILDSQ